MKKIILILTLLTFTNIANAEKNPKSWDYPFAFYGKYQVKGSKDFYNFKSDLRKDTERVLKVNYPNTKFNAQKIISKKKEWWKFWDSLTN